MLRKIKLVAGNPGKKMTPTLLLLLQAAGDSNEACSKEENRNHFTQKSLSFSRVFRSHKAVHGWKDRWWNNDCSEEILYYLLRKLEARDCLNIVGADFYDSFEHTADI